jgi:hypothetical protein
MRSARLNIYFFLELEDLEEDRDDDEREEDREDDDLE